MCVTLYNDEILVVYLCLLSMPVNLPQNENVTNYRRISVLPVFSNILERIMFDRIYKHLKSSNLLFDKQFGFQLNNSTEHAILQLVNDISSSLETGEYTLGIFIDLSRAFDTVDHGILIFKFRILWNKTKNFKMAQKLPK